MRIQTLFEGLKYVLNVYYARHYSGRRRRYDKARACLDTVFSLEDDPPHRLIAFDAVLMTLERRHEEARERYRECLAALPEVLSLDETYVSLYCRLHLAIYDDNRYYEELEELREKAADLNVGAASKFLIPVVSKSQLAEIFGDRKRPDPTFKVKDDRAIHSRVYYSPSFKVR